MIVLGIDTSTEQTSVALGTEREIAGEARFAGARRHDDVVPAIERLLEWTGIELTHVGGVAVGIGPGLYTGLRVGVEAAKALAQVLGVPIVGICSLDVLAFGVQHTGRLIVAVIDARRHEVFYGLYRPVPGGVMRVGEYGVATPARSPPSSRSSARRCCSSATVPSCTGRSSSRLMPAWSWLRLVRAPMGRRSSVWRHRGSSANRPTGSRTWYPCT